MSRRDCSISPDMWFRCGCQNATDRMLEQVCPRAESFSLVIHSFMEPANQHRQQCERAWILCWERAMTRSRESFYLHLRSCLAAAGCGGGLLVWSVVNALVWSARYTLNSLDRSEWECEKRCRSSDSGPMLFGWLLRSGDANIIYSCLFDV